MEQHDQQLEYNPALGIQIVYIIKFQINRNAQNQQNFNQWCRFLIIKIEIFLREMSDLMDL